MDKINSHRAWFSQISLSCALFAISFNTTAINNMLLHIAKDFHVTLSSLQWVVNSYFLVIAAAVVVGGQLGDLYGRRKMYIIGLSGFIVGLSLAAVSDAVWILIVSRILLALGAALIMPASLSIINVVFDLETRGTAFAIWGAVLGLGFSVGPLLSGLILTALGWRWVFWLGIPMIIFAILIALIAMPESQDKKASSTIDFGGIISLAVGIFSLILFLDQGVHWGYGSSLSLITLGLSLVCILLFVWIELNVKTPLIHIVHFKEKKFLASNIVIFFTNFSLMGFIYQFSVAFQNRLFYGFDALQTGIALLPMSVSFFLVSLFAGKIMDFSGAKKIIVCGMFFLVAGTCWSFLLPSDTHYVQYILPFILFGIGVGLVTGPSQLVALNAVPVENTGEASGITNVSRYIGGAIGVTVTSLVYSYVSKDYLRALLWRMKVDAIDEGILDGWILGKPGTIRGIDPAQLSNWMHDSREALFSGISASMFVMSSLCFLTALLCIILIKNNKPTGN